jgi:hypothetical protein
MVGVQNNSRDEDEDERLLVPYGSDGLGATNTILLYLAIGVKFRRHGMSVRDYGWVLSAFMRLLARNLSRTAFDISQCVAHHGGPMWMQFRPDGNSDAVEPERVESTGVECERK